MNTLSPAATVTLLALVALWIAAAALLVLFPIGLQAWGAWAIALVLIFFVAALVDVLVKRKRKGR